MLFLDPQSSHIVETFPLFFLGLFCIHNLDTPDQIEYLQIFGLIGTLAQPSLFRDAMPVATSRSAFSPESGALFFASHHVVDGFQVYNRLCLFPETLFSFPFQQLLLS